MRRYGRSSPKQRRKKAEAVTGMYEQELARIEQVVAGGPYRDTWESLAQYPVPQWYREAKFGAFIHWGAYTVPAYFSEWYVRLMYYRQNPVYWHHNRTYGKDYPYRKFIEQFTAPHFDADQIVAELKNAGVRYIMPVGEHHDGLKMYDSALSEWTTVKQAMHRDVLGEYKAACERAGVTFAASSHRAEHYWFVNGARTVGYENEAISPAYRELYGDCVNASRHNNLYTLLRQERGIDPSPAWCENWLVHTVEMVDRYRPETLFFDWWVSNHTFRPYMKKFLAYYFNRSLVWGKEVCVQYKSDAVMYNAAVFDRERGQLATVSPYIWQSETSTAYNAWSYCTTNRWKTSEEIACVFADVIAKNGNFVLNIGPRADGTICEQELGILRDLGRWTARNREAIWGTTPYKVYGEGRRQKTGSFQERNRYTHRDFRYTYRPCHIYAFALKPSRHGVYHLKALRDSMDGFHFQVQSVRVLGGGSAAWDLNNKRLCIRVQDAPETKMPLVFDIQVD